MKEKKTLRIHLLEVIGPLIQTFRRRLLRLNGYVNIDSSVVLERGLNLDRVYPESIYIGPGCLIASGSTILSHEHVYRDPSNPELPLKSPVVIGPRTFVGVGATILPGITIGSDCLIAAGAIVVKDVPSGSLVVGVPGRVVKTGLVMDSKARLIVSQ